MRLVLNPTDDDTLSYALAAALMLAAVINPAAFLAMVTNIGVGAKFLPLNLLLLLFCMTYAYIL